MKKRKNYNRYLADDSVPYYDVTLPGDDDSFFRERRRRAQRKELIHRIIIIGTIAFLIIGVAIGLIVKSKRAKKETNRDSYAQTDHIRLSENANTEEKTLETLKSTSIENETVDEKSQTEAEKKTEAYKERSSIHYFGKRLTKEQQEVYRQIERETEVFSEKYLLTGCSFEEISEIYKAFYKDHPEYYWLSGGYSCSGTRNERELIFTPWIRGTITEAKKGYSELQSIKKEILSKASGLSNYDKLLFYHDYLVEHTSYDFDGLMNGTYITSLSGSVYGCLVKNSAVCSGYASAFQLLAQESGIECFCVEGNSLHTGESHEWNCVEIGGKYYYVDVTWDDPIHTDGSGESLEHNYFCITTDELLRSHVIKEDVNVPLCTATDYEYHHYYHQYIDTYDFNNVSGILENQAEEKEICVKFGCTEALEAAYDDLVTNRKIYSVPKVSEKCSQGYMISRNDDSFVLKFIFSDL